ncbi:MAG: hypothetical protein ABW352_17110 [Polyangiales bacterium]
MAVVASSAPSCARPSLDEVTDAGEVPPTDDAGQDSASQVTEEPDAGSVVPPPPKDAGGPPVVTPDAGCPDADGDRICDEDDNCPDEPNADQADEDADGVGDMCTVVEVNCGDGEEVETGAISNTATLAQLVINGTTDRVVNVKADSQISVSFQLTFNECSAFSFGQVFLGLESGEAARCQPTGCTSGVEVPLPYEFTIPAPATPGLHYLLAGLRQALTPTGTSCQPRGDAGAAASKRVAALCVTK